MAADSNEKIIEQLSVAIKSNPNDANAFFNRGLINGELGNNKAAIADYREAIRLNPSLKDPLKPHFEKATAALPSDPRIDDLLKRGQELYDVKDFENAASHFSTALELDSLGPKAAGALNDRAACYGQQEKFDLSQKDCNEAIRLNPYLNNAFGNRGFAYSKKGQYDLAINDYNESLRLKPNNVIAIVNRGCAYFNQGNYGLAIKDFKEAVSLNPLYESSLNAWREQAAAKVANKETKAPETPLNPISMLDEIAKVRSNLKAPSLQIKKESTDEKSSMKASIQQIIVGLTQAQSENKDPNLQMLNSQVSAITNVLGEFKNKGMKDEKSLVDVLKQMGDITRLSNKKGLFANPLQAAIIDASTKLTEIKGQLFAGVDNKNILGK